jgi:ribosomal protein L11
MAAGAALAAKRGEGKKSSLKGPSKQMVKMSEKQLRDIAKTKRKKLPSKKK